MYFLKWFLFRKRKDPISNKSVLECLLVHFPSYIILTLLFQIIIDITGLVNALKLLQPIKEKYSGVTYADLFQLASATAIEVFSSYLLYL